MPADRSVSHLFTRGLVLLALVAFSGCSTPSTGPAPFSRGEAIHEVHLFVSPVALRSSPASPADGLALRVFASSRSHAKGVPIRGGTLDILVFDGAPDETTRRSATPAQIWSFPAAKLPPFAVTSSLGTGYELALQWQGPRPEGSRLTLVARHTPASGAVVLASPSVIPNSLR